MAARRPAAGSTNSMSAKRIRKEIADLARENLGAITLTPNESNIFQWRATLPGPAGSPYEGGVFDVDIRVPDDYPFSPPHLQFLTKVYHCNIAHTGAICLDLLKTAWSPALSLYKVVLSLSSLLTDPNPADPLVPSIAQEYKKNRKKHDDIAREWVKLYAMPATESITAPPPAQEATPPPRASSSRPRAIHRHVPGGDVAPPAPLAGTRRSAPGSNGNSGAGSRPGQPITLMDDEDDDDGVVITGGSNGVASGSRSGTAAAEGSSSAGPSGPRRSKRARVDANGANGSTSGAGPSHDDVIVIDD